MGVPDGIGDAQVAFGTVVVVLDATNPGMNRIFKVNDYEDISIQGAETYACVPDGIPTQGSHSPIIIYSPQSYCFYLIIDLFYFLQ